MTDTVRIAVCKSLAKGCPIKYACMGAGISERTFENWCNKARKPDAAADYVRFLREVEIAKGKAVEKYRALVAKSAKTQWKAAAWMLSILDRDTFGTDREELKALKALIEKLIKGDGAK